MVLESLQDAVVTLRGHLGKPEGSILSKSSKKLQQQQTQEVVKATLYLKKVNHPPTPVIIG